MNLYDYNKAFDIIEANKDKIASAVLTIVEDFFFTSKTIWTKTAGYLVDLDDPFWEICGIGGSMGGALQHYIFTTKTETCFILIRL